VIVDPPVALAVNATDIWPFPGVANVTVGAAGGVPYIRADGSVNEPLLLGVNVTGPTLAGVIVNVCGVRESLNVSTIAVESPPPAGVIVIVPVYNPFGVTVKIVDAVFSEPPVGPENV
jgi:hypothetical protein